MWTRIIAWLAALLFIAFLVGIATHYVTTPANAQSCMTWETGMAVAADYAANKEGVRVAAVLLTPEETMAVFPILMPSEPIPERFGVMISNDDPDKAFVAGFDAAGCLIGSGGLPLGPVLDAMVQAGVKSEFVNIEPSAGPGEGA
jgi:hypothetical protein